MITEFLEADYDKFGECEIEEEDGCWKAAHLFKHKARGFLVVYFPIDNEFEGLDGSYSFADQAMKDGDGDVIDHRNFVEIVPTGVTRTLKKSGRRAAAVRIGSSESEGEDNDEEPSEPSDEDAEDDDDASEVEGSSRKRSRNLRSTRNARNSSGRPTRSSNTLEDESEESEDGDDLAATQEARARLEEEEEIAREEAEEKKREEAANHFGLETAMRNVEHSFEIHGPPQPALEIQATKKGEISLSQPLLKEGGFWANIARAASGDGDLEVLGTSGPISLVDFPHPREDCLMLKFSATEHKMFCKKCYCYVCDAPASSCSEWSVHCDATRTEKKWQDARTRAKQQTTVQAAQEAMEEEEEAAQYIPQYNDQDDDGNAADDATEVKSLWSQYDAQTDYGGSAHPDSVVETTSLAYVKIPEFNSRRLGHADNIDGSIPMVMEREKIMTEEAFNTSLSNIQLETVWYSMVRHDEKLPNGSRAGYFIGD